MAGTRTVFLIPMLLSHGAAAASKPADLPRVEICLNGGWETVLNADTDKIPSSGWSVRRAPAMPIATNPPTNSVWYRLSIEIPREWLRADRRFLLKVEKAGHYAAVYLNGRKVGEHYGQFTPFETDVTSALRAGETNEIAIFVHNASGKYARPGVALTDPMEGNAYRGATEQDFQRNWVGIVGDIFLAWRPAAHIADVFAVPSVRKHELEARVDVAGAGVGLTLRAAVLDDGKVLLHLPDKAVAEDGGLSVKAAWSNPVLWGPERYGKPKLYVLRTELWRRGKLVDRRFTRFGFREVWIEGRDVLLNGKKLWMAGTYFGKLAAIRYLNDRHPQYRMIEAMQAAGLNTSYGHWDELGESWLDRCDEMGMLALGAFYCDGRPKIQSKADPGWADWMADTCRVWVRTTRNHPSIVMWRPTDVLPQNVFGSRETFNARLAVEVRHEDGTRPLADDSDIAAWSQSPFRNQQSKEYDDGSRMASQLAALSKPLLTKEIYTGFGDVENLSRFFRVFCEKSYTGGSTGILVQHLPVIQEHGTSHLEWLSDSGLGNRDTAVSGGFPNWYDPTRSAWTATSYGRLFADLQEKFVKSGPVPTFVKRGSARNNSEKIAPELLVSGLAPDELAMWRHRIRRSTTPSAHGPTRKARRGSWRPGPDRTVCTITMDPRRSAFMRNICPVRRAMTPSSASKSNRGDRMNRKEATQSILAAKQAKGVTFDEVARAVGRHKVWTTSALLGQSTMSKEESERAVECLGLGKDVSEALQQIPRKGSLDETVPVDPLIYRFHEITQVYGTTIKAVIHEMFGDGIMSAIDFTMDIERVPDPHGDRVKVTYNGKFLPYKKW